MNIQVLFRITMNVCRGELDKIFFKKKIINFIFSEQKNLSQSSDSTYQKGACVRNFFYEHEKSVKQEMFCIK